LFEVGVLELEARGFETVRGDTGTIEEERLAHLAEGEAKSEGGHRQKRRTRENPREDSRELGVGDGIRGDRVEGTRQSSALDRVLQRSDQVVDADPAHVLAAIPEAPTQTHPEEREHLGQRPAFGR
jgi:hypothetical protein